MTRWGDEPIAIDKTLSDGRIERSWYRSNHLIEVQLLPPRKQPFTDSLKPGPELNALIFQRVIGIDVNKLDVSAIPRFSTDPGAAWIVVEKLGLEVGPTVDDGGIRDGWYAEQPGKIVSYSKAATAPHAICLAALKAVA